MTSKQQATEAKSYKTQDNAMKELTRALTLAGRTPEDTRFVILAQPDGRFTPAILPMGDRDQATLIGIIHVSNVVVLG